MKTSIITALLSMIIFIGFTQERNIPVFSSSDSLNVFGEWQSKQYETKKGDKIQISYRFKVRKTFMLTCLYSIEVRNDSEKSISVYFMAGNKGTNYYSGQIGVVSEKVKLSPNSSMLIDYRLPTKTNSSEDSESIMCRKCKELDHIFTFVE